jgi:hypothetical protein
MTERPERATVDPHVTMLLMPAPPGFVALRQYEVASDARSALFAITEIACAEVNQQTGGGFIQLRGGQKYLLRECQENSHWLFELDWAFPEVRKVRFSLGK